MKIKRFFIPVSLCGFILPFVISDLTNLATVGLCYFWSSYIILWNFPSITKSLNAEPLYLKDLEETKYKKYYLRIMNICLAILIGLFADYGLIKGILNDKTIIEITAIIGGNLSLLSTIQSEIGSNMLSICHCLKQRNEISHELNDKHKLSEITIIK